MSRFKGWPMRTEIPSAPGAYEVHYPGAGGIERRQRFGTEAQAEAFARRMGGKVVPVVPRGKFVLRSITGGAA